MVDSNANRSGTRADGYNGPVTRSRMKSDGNKHAPRVIYGTIGWEEEEAEEWRQDDIADMLRWEAKCFGYIYLGDHEMKEHNSVVLLHELHPPVLQAIAGISQFPLQCGASIC